MIAVPINPPALLHDNPAFGGEIMSRGVQAVGTIHHPSKSFRSTIRFSKMLGLAGSTRFGLEPALFVADSVFPSRKTRGLGLGGNFSDRSRVVKR